MERNASPESSSPAAAWLREHLTDRVSFASPAEGLSPFFSSLGLCLDDRPGIASLTLYYNRKATVLGPDLLRFLDAPALSVARDPTGQQWDGATARAVTAFAQRNVGLVEAEGCGAARFVTGGDRVLAVESLTRDSAKGAWRVRMKSADARDPAPWFERTLLLVVLRGELTEDEGERAPALVRPDAHGVVRVAVTILDANDSTAEEVAAKLSAAVGDVAAARAATWKWVADTLAGWAPPARVEGASVLARAVYGLLSNAVAAPGFLAGHVAAFPNRATYACHYLWDSCFQNLALESLNGGLARDALLLLARNQAPDGKIPQFICSTWVRPGESQSPLLGWAGLRLVHLTGDRALAAELLPALERNTTWWLRERGEPGGLIRGAGPMETGWDDTPRFDGGPVIATDLNTYLLLQMRACAELAELLGRDSASHRAQAEEFARRIVTQLFAPDDGLFYDRQCASGEMVRLRTPACFLPYLAGVPVRRDEARAAVSRHLLNPAKFFGAVPFPSVAYDEPVHNPGQWWRGPLWLPVGYLMLEVLAALGFDAERRAAAERLLDLVLRDGNLSELFDAKTGRGLGSRQQGWTAAIALRLAEELARDAGPVRANETKS